MDPVIVDDEETNELKACCEKIITGIDKHFSLHDFRMTKGKKKSKLIFDVEVPLDHKITRSELIGEINRELVKQYPDCYAVIEIDYGYIS